MSPFRDLFVELPVALFDALKGIGEEAVRQAARPPVHHLPSRTAILVDAINGPRGTLLCQRYGWKHVTTWRSATDDDVVFAVRMPCGHKHRFAYPEMVIESSTPTGAIAQLDKAWSRVERCYCVRREWEPG